MIEKAYAKLHANYESLEGGQIREGKKKILKKNKNKIKTNIKINIKILKNNNNNINNIKN